MKRSGKTLFALLLALVMTLGLAATAWATGGDETVGGGGTVVGPVGPGNYPPSTELKIPFTKTVTLGGNTAPGQADFTLEIIDYGNESAEEYKGVTYTAAVTTTGAGSFDGTLIISGPAKQVHEFVCEGFFVREVKGKLSGWTYSDAVWFVTPEAIPTDGSVPELKIYPATMETTDNGEVHFREVAGAAAEEKMTFVNTYTYNHTTQAQRPAEKPNTPETAITAPKTFDAGVALYGVSALLSLTGTALVIKRKNG